MTLRIGIGLSAVLVVCAAWGIGIPANAGDGSQKNADGGGRSASSQASSDQTEYVSTPESVSEDPVQFEPYRVMMILNTVDGELPAWEADQNVVLAYTQSEFADLIDAYSAGPGVGGTIVVTDDPSVPGVWPPAGAGETHLRLTFHDLPYYTEVWQPR